VNQKEASARAEKPSSLSPAPTMAAMGRKHFDELAKIQSDLLEEIREANQNWLDRMQSEATLASEFSSKLTASHSIADTTAACQEWAKRRTELFAEDGQHREGRAVPIGRLAFKWTNGRRRLICLTTVRCLLYQRLNTRKRFITSTQFSGIS
jgi:hypothetical protein